MKWSRNCFLVACTAVTQVTNSKITGTKLYVLVVTLSTQDNTKPRKQLEFSFKRTINWNKYLSKKTNEA